MTNPSNQKNDKQESGGGIKRQSHTFIFRLLPRYLSDGDTKKWYGELQYIRNGERLMKRNLSDIKKMINELTEKIETVISN